MLNSGKNFALCATKKNNYANSRVVRKKNSERNKKPYPSICLSIFDIQLLITSLWHHETLLKRSFLFQNY